MQDERKKVIIETGKRLASELKDFYGNVQLNICDGKFVNANVNESIKPQKEEGSRKTE